jgi:hypothetical protein
VDGSFFDGSTNRAQVLSEREVSARLSRRDVLVEAGLVPKVGAELHSRRLSAFRVTNIGCRIRHIAGAIQRHEQDTVVVSDHEVVGGDDVLAARGGRQGKGVLWIKALWSGRQCSQAEYRQRIIRSSAVSRCKPQITMPDRLARLASKATKSPTQASSERPLLSTTKASPGSDPSIASRNTSTLP